MIFCCCLMASARSGPLQIEHRSGSVSADCGTLLALGPPLVRTLPHSDCNCHSEQDATSTLGFVSVRGMSLYSSSQMLRHIFFGCHHFDGSRITWKVRVSLDTMPHRRNSSKKGSGDSFFGDARAGACLYFLVLPSRCPHAHTSCVAHCE